MKKILAVIVAIFILIISSVVYQITKVILKNSIGLDWYAQYGKTGAFFYAIIEMLPLLIGIWLVKLTWKKITYQEPKSTNEINNNSSSILNSELNHTKDVESDLKPKINEYKDNHKTSKSETTFQNDINEDKIYEQVMLEIEEDKKVKSTWAKALAQSEGNKDKAEALYINLRFDHLKIKSSEKQKNKAKAKQKNKLGDEFYIPPFDFIIMVFIFPLIMIILYALNIFPILEILDLEKYDFYILPSFPIIGLILWYLLKKFNHYFNLKALFINLLNIKR